MVADVPSICKSQEHTRRAHEHQHDGNQEFLDLGGFLDCSFNSPAAGIGRQIGAAWLLIDHSAKSGKKNISIETLCEKSASIFPTCSGNYFWEQGGNAYAF
ncbi:MAG TPA: hypothetical protein VFR24_00325 [Candidatus Angelobacter sp.]|nr:hypothetical protein [Candidatus Angelobacter sp.]